MSKNKSGITISDIKKSPNEYKVCKLCDSVNATANRRCHNCNHTMFNSTTKEVLFAIATLETRYASVSTAGWIGGSVEPMNMNELTIPVTL